MKGKGFSPVGSPEEIRKFWQAEVQIPRKMPKVTLPAARESRDPVELMLNLRRLVDLIDAAEILSHTDLGDLDGWLQNLREDLTATIDKLEEIR